MEPAGQGRFARRSGVRVTHRADALAGHFRPSPAVGCRDPAGLRSRWPSPMNLRYGLQGNARAHAIAAAGIPPAARARRARQHGAALMGATRRTRLLLSLATIAALALAGGFLASTFSAFSATTGNAANTAAAGT